MNPKTDKNVIVVRRDRDGMSVEFHIADASGGLCRRTWPERVRMGGKRPGEIRQAQPPGGVRHEPPAYVVAVRGGPGSGG